MESITDFILDLFAECDFNERRAEEFEKQLLTQGSFSNYLFPLLKNCFKS